jgi:hypothetical protein
MGRIRSNHYVAVSSTRGLGPKMQNLEVVHFFPVDRRVSGHIKITCPIGKYIIGQRYLFRIEPYFPKGNDYDGNGEEVSEEFHGRKGSLASSKGVV